MSVFTANLAFDYRKFDLYKNFANAGFSADSNDPSHKFYVYPGNHIEIAVKGHDFMYTSDDVPFSGTTTSAQLRIYDASGEAFAVGYNLTNVNITAAQAAHYITQNPQVAVADIFKGVDVFRGSHFSDRLNGFGGSDVLTGGDGNDIFYFTTALSSRNIDRITDFTHDSVEHDKIALSKTVFKLDPHQSVSTAFHDITNSGFGAEQDDDHILYNHNNGYLYYDADGKGGHGPVHFATLDHHPVLTSGDILMV